MLKKILILVSFIFANSSMPMTNEVNRLNDFGQTPLHNCVMLPDEIINFYLPHKDKPTAAFVISIMAKRKENMPESDSKLATIAGKFYWMGADIYIKDKAGLSPWDYAKKNKDQLPEVFKVLNAINVINIARNKFPKPDQGGVFSLNQLVNMKPMSDKELMEWAEAESILSKYKQ